METVSEHLAKYEGHRHITNVAINILVCVHSLRYKKVSLCFVVCLCSVTTQSSPSGKQGLPFYFY